MKHTKYRAAKAPQLKAPPLDMSSVATAAPPERRPANPPTRIFGLEDAPCFYPSVDEFMEPLRYIESIRAEAEKTGICKIVPPEGWKPTFALDSEVFRFRTRIQKLNSMEGETRSNMNYVEQLHKFHSQQGHPVHKMPQLDKRPIDLFRLRKEVAARGGYQKVTGGKKWAEVGRDMDYTRKQVTSLSSALKSAYLKVILPYEIHLSKQAKATGDTPATQDVKRESQQEFKRESQSDLHTNGSTTGSQASASSTPSNTADTPLTQQTRKSKRIKKDPVSYAGNEPGSVQQEDLSEETPDVCELCHTENDLDKMLICDGCELGYHTYCLKPPLQNIPKTDWYCSKCLVVGDDLAFDEGEEYSLSSFQQRCSAFKKSWFDKAGLAGGLASEDDVEREFWRLVNNAQETVEVEYGTDLHSAQYGSGFPTLERNPSDKYAAHPANLNNIPVLPESLFSHIKSDISSLMVPWLYVGMCFSAFCWRNKEHYTYSINYLHWGDTKTWYGVPATDALKFENTMRQEVPELFEQQPDLLLKLVTMLSPERLVKNGVKVVALDQRPGQFVVTFPQVYHAGFNHGFNFAEEVNFAPPDWCRFGQECVQRYKQHKKPPLFSHDELIMATTLNDPSIATARWLRNELSGLLDRELAHRRSVLKQHPAIKVVTNDGDRSEDETQCLHCNAYLCKCDTSSKTLRLRYTDDRLREITQTVVETAAIPDNWVEKFKSTMMETRLPSLKLLRSLLAAAERIPFPIKEAGHLRKFVAQANEWVESVTKVLVRKHYHQGRRLLDRAPSNERRLEDLKEMLRQVERLRFDCQEIKQLEESIETMQAFQLDARQALSKPEHNLQECRELYETGVAMNIGMDEIDSLELIVKDLTWIERATAKGVHLDDYQLICSLIADAERSGVSASNPLLTDLTNKQLAGQRWEERALEIMAQTPVDIQELQTIIETGRHFPVPRNVFSRAEQLYGKVVDGERVVKQLAARCSNPNFVDRPSIAELKRALKIADSNLINVADKEMFESEARKYDDWIATCQSLFMPAGAKRLELEEAMDDVKDNMETCTADEGILASPTVNGHQRLDTAPDTHVVSPLATDSTTGLDSQIIAVMPIGASLDVPPSKGVTSLIETSSPIKDDPVQPTQASETSKADTLMDVDREDQIYCLCRSSEAGMMVECDECHEWYHGTCVRLTKREASAKSNYICPVCNLSLVIRRDRPRPTLDMVASCFEAGIGLRFFTPEVPVLGTIVDVAKAFEKRVDRFLGQAPITADHIPQLKAFLRKIEGMDVELVAQRAALRSHILRLCPGSMPTPGVMLSNYPAAPPLSASNSYCLCNQEHAPGELQDNHVMVQCGICEEWYHPSCMGMSLAQAQRLPKFACPVCCIVRKKPYQAGEMRFPDEAHLRAVEKLRLSKIQAEAKRKRRKPSKEGIDVNDGVPAGVEERKKRPYKRREQTENGEKIKLKRRRSSVGSQFTPAIGSAVISGSQAPSQPASTTKLPSFSEGFMLPHDRPPSHQEQLQHPHHHAPASAPYTHPRHQPQAHHVPHGPQQQQSYAHHPQHPHHYPHSPPAAHSQLRYRSPPRAQVQTSPPPFQHASRGPSELPLAHYSSQKHSFSSHPRTHPAPGHQATHSAYAVHVQREPENYYAAPTVRSAVQEPHELVYGDSDPHNQHRHQRQHQHQHPPQPHPNQHPHPHQHQHQPQYPQPYHPHHSYPSTASSAATTTMRPYAGYNNIVQAGPAPILPPIKHQHSPSPRRGGPASIMTTTADGVGSSPMETFSGGETETDDDRSTIAS
ncbi:hypothetical protein BGZ70_003605 [Mortierella alpina]|uniref:[histone H3]-trimethyl-L-lysine(4) demethylase n=1 Tax=Mortierella alpina TaxID=64518 RepID=A0A9P6JAL5_MORAP|nr:hypothetical protein BGZ70_003605 [Mortierella alpina]